jgi:hypothetical protein
VFQLILFLLRDRFGATLNWLLEGEVRSRHRVVVAQVELLRTSSIQPLVVAGHRLSADELTTAALKHSVRVDVLSVEDDGAPRHDVEDEGRVTDDAVILVVEIAALNYGGERFAVGFLIATMSVTAPLPSYAQRLN